MLAFALYTEVLLCWVHAAAKPLESFLTPCDPIDGSPPGSPVPGIPQARTLVWVAISFSNAWKWKVKVKSLSLVWLLATPWTAAYQAPPSMGFSSQEYWSGVPLPSPHTIIKRIKLREQKNIFSSVQLSHPAMSYSLWPHGLQHARLPCPSPTAGAYSKSCPSYWWCHATISFSVIPFSSLFQSFPASGSFPISWFFTSGG